MFRVWEICSFLFALFGFALKFFSSPTFICLFDYFSVRRFFKFFFYNFPTPPPYAFDFSFSVQLSFELLKTWMRGAKERVRERGERESASVVIDQLFAAAASCCPPAGPLSRSPSTAGRTPRCSSAPCPPRPPPGPPPSWPPTACRAPPRGGRSGWSPCRPCLHLRCSGRR